MLYFFHYHDLIELIKRIKLNPKKIVKILDQLEDNDYSRSMVAFSSLKTGFTDGNFSVEHHTNFLIGDNN